MKYFIIISIVFFVSCNNLKKEDVAYELTNNAIDSIITLNDIVTKMNASQMPRNEDLYRKATVDRYAFGKIYLAAVRKVSDSTKKHELVERYMKEVLIEPNWLFPDNLKIIDTSLGTWQ